MSPEKDHDILLRLEQRLEMFYDEFRRTSNGDGFPRCAERLARLEAVEEELKAHKSKFWWLITFIIGQTVAFVLSILKGGLN